MAHTRTHVIQDPDILVTTLEDGHIEVATVIEGVLDSLGNPTYYRYVLHPGAYVGDKDPRVQTLAARIHTARVITDWKAVQELDR